MSGYTILCMFLVYGFVGWIAETVYLLISTKKLANRGFLQGPVLVAYGLAPVAVSAALIPFNSLDGWLTYPLTVIISFATVFVFEYAASKVFEKIFNRTVWEKTGKNSLIKNIILGVALSLVMIFVQPWLNNFINVTISYKMLLFLTVALLILVLDVIYSCFESVNIKTKISAAKEIEEMLNKANPDSSIKIYAKTDSLGDKREEFDKKCAKYKRFIISNNFVYKRLADAYPNIDAEQNLKLLEDLRYMYYLLKKK